MESEIHPQLKEHIQIAEKVYRREPQDNLIKFVISISRLERDISHLQPNLDLQIAISGILPLNFNSLPQDLKTKLQQDLKTKLQNVRRSYEAIEGSIEYYQEKFPELNGLIRHTQNLYSHLETIVRIPSD